MHEASLHAENAFITLTYSPENLPPGGTLQKKDFQDFIKRLRRKYPARCVGVGADGKKIFEGKTKYFHCGEYGERNRRPHYHALLFGLDFPDKVLFKNSADGSAIYTSEILQRLWPAGFCTTGAVTFESAAYVARYVMKKITGEPAKAHYENIDLETGEIIDRLPEYTTMSLKPAIAKDWYKQFKSDVYPSDQVILRGMPMKPPKFYDRLLELEDPEARAAIRERRMKDAVRREADNTSRRLRDREVVKLAQINQLKRELE